MPLHLKLLLADRTEAVRELRVVRDGEVVLFLLQALSRRCGVFVGGVGAGAGEVLFV
jgi:hypothetical protein